MPKLVLVTSLACCTNGGTAGRDGREPIEKEAKQTAVHESSGVDAGLHADLSAKELRLVEEHVSRLIGVPRHERWPALRDTLVHIRDERLKREITLRLARADEGANAEPANPPAVSQGIDRANVKARIRIIQQLPTQERSRALLYAFALVTDARVREKLLVLLAREFGRTKDEAIKGAIQRAFTDDPCAMAAATRLFPFLTRIGVRCRPYLSKEDVTKHIRVARELDPAARKASIHALLEKLSIVQNEAEYKIVDHAMHVLADEYRQTHDDTILEAVDSYEFGMGGYATQLCAFYLYAHDAPGFRERYGRAGSAQTAAQRCVGISLSGDELAPSERKD